MKGLQGDEEFFTRLPLLVLEARARLREKSPYPLSLNPIANDLGDWLSQRVHDGVQSGCGFLTLDSLESAEKEMGG